MHDRSSQTAALIVATLASFAVPFMGSAVHVALPAIEADFRIEALTLSWVASAYLLAAAVVLVPAGKLADIHGRKRIFLLGNTLFTTASLLCALAPSAELLIVLRILQGAGSAMIFATGIAIVTSVFPPERRGSVLGINVAAVYVGLSCGPFAGGLVTAVFSWRGIFLSIVPLGLVTIYLTRRRLVGEWADARGEAFDHWGALSYAAAVILVMVGLSRPPSWVSIVYLAAGVAVLITFVVWEQRVPAPVFEVRLMAANRVFAFSCLAALINYSATFALTFLLSLYLQHIRGLAPQAAGGVLMAQPVMMALFSPVAGRLSDRVEPRYIASLGMALTAKGLVLLSFLGAQTSIWYVVACLLLLGFGFALFSSPNMNAIMGSVERRFYGIASGSVGTMRLLGQMTSMGIATLVLTFCVGSVPIATAPDGLLRSTQISFSLFALLCAAGVLFSLARGRLHKDG